MAGVTRAWSASLIGSGSGATNSSSPSKSDCQSPKPSASFTELRGAPSASLGASTNGTECGSGASSNNSALTHDWENLSWGLWRVVPDLGHQHQSSNCWASHGLCLHLWGIHNCRINSISADYVTASSTCVGSASTCVNCATQGSSALSSSSLSLDNTWNRHRVLTD